MNSIKMDTNKLQIVSDKKNWRDFELYQVTAIPTIINQIIINTIRINFSFKTV